MFAIQDQGPKDYRNTRILRSGFKVQDRGGSRSHGLKDPHVGGASWAPGDFR